MPARTRSTEWCVVDLETTGIYPNGTDRVVEIALVVIDDSGNHLEEWHSLVNPHRDLGPSWIHGITADLTNQAPTFAELAGDIFHLIDGRRLAAHNASFERRFLNAEFERGELDIQELDLLCTMQIASRMGIGRKLDDCCNATGIENVAPHVALGDARATADLLAYFLKIRDREGAWPRGIRLPDRIQVIGRIDPTGRALTRETAGEINRPRSYLSRLAGRLPTPRQPSGVSQEVAADYAALLDRVLEDRIVTDDELADLADLALDMNLGARQLAEINLSYLNGLVSIALADGIVTDAERHDLERAAALLGIDSKALDSLISADYECSEPIVPGSGGEFEGMTVCFTGASTCMMNAERLSRGLAAQVATAAGLTVKTIVTKTLDILVVADSDTQSGKAKKARGYGTRIITERSFWPRVGVTID